MRKCIRCQIVFQSDERLYCLYCDSGLMATDLRDASAENVFESGSKVSHYEKIAKSAGPLDLERVQYLASCYLKARSFSFIYSISRNQYKMGKDYRQTLVQPIDLSFIIRLPWLMINILDSLALRGVYTGFCPDCQWKFVQVSAQNVHDPVECEYNREYRVVLEDILNGKIVQTETEHAQRSLQKRKEGKRSAYLDLSQRKRSFETFIDTITILLSMGFIFYLLAQLVMPLLDSIYHF